MYLLARLSRSGIVVELCISASPFLHDDVYSTEEECEMPRATLCRNDALRTREGSQLDLVRRKIGVRRIEVLDSFYVVLASNKFLVGLSRS